MVCEPNPCVMIVQIQHFVTVHSRYEYGLVSHALAAALQAILKDYFILVAQLEHQLKQGSLTLLRCWFYVQPTMASLARLQKVFLSLFHLLISHCTSPV